MSSPAAPSTTTAPQRPLLKPALRRLWRGPASLQLGTTAAHAVVLSGIGTAERHVLELLDGTRTVDDVATHACARGGNAEAARQLVATLAAAGALDDAAVAAPPIDEAQRQRLEPDRLALSLLRPEPGAAATALRRRRDAAVTVYGAGRIGATIAALLGAAGVGQLGCVDEGPLRAADLAPGGLRTHVARRRDEAATAELTTVAPATRTTTGPLPEADLTIVATVGTPLPELVHAVRRTPHLLVSVQETTAAVGPFVLPGRTPCLRCVQLHRSDRDPAWPAIAAQLVGSRLAVEPCDIVLATLAAGLAAAQALAWIDRSVAPESAGGVLELDLRQLQLRRRSLAPHPACGCGAAG